MEQARRDGYQSCLVLLPASYGPWIPEVEQGLRAGGLLSSGRISYGLAEKLCLPIVMAGARSNARLGRD